MKELKKKWHNESIVLSINESFDPSQIIGVLRGTQIERRGLALFLKFSLPRIEVGCKANSVYITFIHSYYLLSGF